MQWKLSLTLLNKAIAKDNENIRANAGKLKKLTQKEYWRFNGILLLCGITKTGGVKKRKPDELRRFYIWQYLARLK